MKDSEFIDLLNLYLDHEISAADAARLEAEVQSNPARRRVYQDYCRMQKACKILAQDFATDTAEADRKIVAFDAAQAAAAAPRRNNTYYIASAFAAAAACIAVVLVNHRQNNSTVPQAPSFVQTTPAAEKNVTPAVAAPQPQLVADAPKPREAAQPRFANGLSLRRNAQSEALVAAATADADARLEWLQNVRLAPIQQPASVDQLRFDAAASQRTDSRVYSSGRQPLPSDVQWTAIRFQK